MKNSIILSVMVLLIISFPQQISGKMGTGRRGKIFDMCSLAKELHRLGIPRTELPDWVCIALHESSYNTRAKRQNRDKTTSWGLFQINDKRWCLPPEDAAGDRGHSADLCGVKCEDLVTDDITAATECARHIKESNKKGFGNWALWRNKCQYHKPDIKICF